MVLGRANAVIRSAARVGFPLPPLDTTTARRPAVPHLSLHRPQSRQFRSRRKRAAGQIGLTATLTFLLFAGFVGFGADTGYRQITTWRLQAAADDAALAALLRLGPQSAATASAPAATHAELLSAVRDALAARGLTRGPAAVSFTVNRPPTTGPFDGDPAAVDVLVSQTGPPRLLRTLGLSPALVVARAVAHWGSSLNCMYALNPAGSATLVVSGATVETDCGVFVASRSSEALVVAGNACLRAPLVALVGSLRPGSCLSQPTLTGVDAEGDPLAYLSAPARPALERGCATPYRITSGARVLYPGLYPGGISVAGRSAGVTLLPGLYYIEGGGFNVADGASIDGAGITIFNSAGNRFPYRPIVIAGARHASLSPATSGPLSGILLYQDPRVGLSTAENLISQVDDIGLSGVLYFPTAPLALAGGSSVETARSILVAYTLRISGPIRIEDPFSALASGSPIRRAIVVE